MEEITWKCPQSENTSLCLNYKLDQLQEMVSDYLVKLAKKLRYREESKEAYKFQESLSEVALAHYLRHAPDIRKCPRRECKGAGFVPMTTDGQIACTSAENFICSLCAHKWVDPLQLEVTVESSVENFLSNLRNLLCS